MRQKLYASLLMSVLFLCPIQLTHAQKPAPMPRIGIVRAGMPATDGSPDEFMKALHDLGYIDKKNIVIEIRYAKGDRDRLREFAKELVQLKVDVIFTASSPAVFALKQETKTIPIV